MDEVLVSAISGIGFPAVLCFYLLTRMNETLKDLTEAIKGLNAEVKEREQKTQDKIEALKAEYNHLRSEVEKIGERLRYTTQAHHSPG